MDAPQKTSSVTILIRLSACAIMGFGIMLLFAGAFLVREAAAVCFAAVLVIGFAAVLISVNPRKPANPPDADRTHAQ